MTPLFPYINMTTLGHGTVRHPLGGGIRFHTHCCRTPSLSRTAADKGRLYRGATERQIAIMVELHTLSPDRTAVA